MKLMIRNTSRDKTTAALRKARPGDVQPNPMIKKIRLPPGGSLTVDSNNLGSADALLVQKLLRCGCLRVFSTMAAGPMRPITADEIGELCDLQVPAPTPAPLPTIPAPEPEPEPEPAPEPEPEPEAAEEAPESEPEEAPVAEESVPYLEGELKLMRNAELRSILSDMGYGRTTGMNKSALSDAILEMQES